MEKEKKSADFQDSLKKFKEKKKHFFLLVHATLTITLGGSTYTKKIPCPEESKTIDPSPRTPGSGSNRGFLWNLNLT